MVLVRFAPSPTGFLHIGGARTALFNWLFARKNQGKFLLRIEDTDQERSKKEYTESIMHSMKWLNIEPDMPPVYQSQNKDRHVEMAQLLIKKNLAYWCSCPKEKKEAPRGSIKKKHVYNCRGPGEGQVLRIKTPENELLEFDDLVHGVISAKTNEIDDFIILRSDGSPVYQFCAPVDDSDMNITHVIRGDDHINNTLAQIIIYKLLNLKQPKFAHIPLIRNALGEKLSKRRDAVDTMEYKAMGILPEAFKNYLLSLGFSYGNKEIFTQQEAIDYFDFKHVNNSPARFNMDKLLHMNSQYLKQESPEKILLAIEEIYHKQHDSNIPEDKKNSILKGMSGLIERSNTLCDILKNAHFYISNQITPNKEDVDNFVDVTALKTISKMLEKIDIWNEEEIKKIFAEIKQQNIKTKIIMQSLRIALTGVMQSPAILEVMIALGKKECLLRVKKFC